AVLQDLGGRRGGEDHHRAEGEQAEGRGQQQAVLGRDRGAVLRLAPLLRRRRARPAERDVEGAHPRSVPSSATISRKRSPRASKFGKASKLAQAGESRTTSPGFAASAAARTALSRSATRWSGTPAAAAG